MRPSLLFFVDGLADSLVRERSLLGWLSQHRAVVPNLGYSATQKPQILRGKTPDDLGYLNLWQYAGPPTVEMHPLGIASTVLRDRVPLIDKVIHKAIEKLGWSKQNIPFSIATGFSQIEDDAYGGGDSLVGGSQWRRIVSEHLHNPPKDKFAISAVHALIDQGEERIFVALTELDHIGHEFGVGTKYAAHAEILDAAMALLTRDFLARHPLAFVAVFSDHGMTNVTESIRLRSDLFRGRRNIIYPHFIDSTMVRVWCPPGEVQDEVSARLRAIPDVRVVSEEERKIWGVSSPDFGRIIAVCSPGMVFSPNFFGIKRPRGMHGYHPEVESNWAVVAGNRPFDVHSPKVGVSELFKWLKSYAGDSE